MQHFLTGIKLADMADINRRKEIYICKLFTVTSMLVMVIYSVANFYGGFFPFAAINAFGAVLCLLNCWQLISGKHGRMPSLLLTIALLIQAVCCLYFSFLSPAHSYWLFPIMGVIIYLNTFRTSLLISIMLVLTTVLSILGSNDWTTFNLSIFLENRLLFSLTAFCVICLISNYYFSKSVRYIQDLYQSGIQELAYKDRLTGLANRWSFEAWTNKILEEERESSNITALIFLDIDNFKCINDGYGHDTGDKLLQNFAKRLQNSIRTVNRKTNEHEFSIARYAGDEFMILLHDIPSIKAIESIVKRINGLFESGVAHEHNISSLTFSIGIALYKEDADTLEELIQCADKAMYAAKKSGKNQYRFYQTNSLEIEQLSHSNAVNQLHLVN